MDTTKASLDISYIKKMSAGDDAIEKQLLQILIDQLKTDLPRASRLLANKDWNELARFCHHFKSTIVFTGNNNLIKANLQLWDTAKNQGKSPIKPEKTLRTMQKLAKIIEKEARIVLKKM